MLNSKSRFGLFIEGTPVIVRFVPYRGDATRVMVKGTGEGPKMFCELAGIEVLSENVGSNFTMVAVDRIKLVEGVTALTAKVLDVGEPTVEHVIEEGEVAVEAIHVPDGAVLLDSVLDGLN